MSAFTMTTAKVFAAPKLGRSTARRGSVVVRAEKVAHGKGGEEGGATFNNDAFGMVAKNANYMLFATAVSKVRRLHREGFHDSIDRRPETRLCSSFSRVDDTRLSHGIPGKRRSFPRGLSFFPTSVPSEVAREARSRPSTRLKLDVSASSIDHVMSRVSIRGVTDGTHARGSGFDHADTVRTSALSGRNPTRMTSRDRFRVRC
jgi:hypothetical protein